MANSIRTPKQGVTVTSQRIARAVDNEEWQKFRISLKGRSTMDKLGMLRAYWASNAPAQMVLGNIDIDMNDDVCIRIDNYIKALCRGGQLHPGESLQSALDANWGLNIKKG